ncbi:MAG TPA: hypothetical protein VFI03_09325 [Solirubrobacterales bacterium]|nr:hypothetical protein [Solirubrobacterales bacterium]
MSNTATAAEHIDTAQLLVEELLRTAVSLSGLLTSLIEGMSEDAFPGEDPGEVLLEMMAGSSLPAVEAAGRAPCQSTTALVVAVREEILGDLRAAARLASAGDQVLL